MDSKLLFDLIEVALICSIISSQAIQKIKATLKLSKTFNGIMSIVISFTIGFGYALSFYNSSMLYATWIGIFSLIGAEGLYKTFKGFFGLDKVEPNHKEKPQL